MEIKDFIDKFEAQFDDAEGLSLNADTKFRNIEGWSSLINFSIIAMVEEEYRIKIKADDIARSQTIKDLFEIVKSRI
jgi:acyl carrier protein